MTRRWLFLLPLLLLLASACWWVLQRDAKHGPVVVEGGAAVNAIATDAQGNLYINQQTRNRVMQMTPGGKVAVYAGTGTRGLSGDGGPATAGQLSAPTSMALDGEGNLFLADTGNSRVRRVDANTHTLSTVAGDSYAGDWDEARAFRPDDFPTDVPPIALAADAESNLYIAGQYGMGIRRAGASDNVWTKVMSRATMGDASSPNVSVMGPYGLATGSQGSLFFSEPNRHTVSVMRQPLRDVQRMAGGGVCAFGGDGGPALGAWLCSPEGIAASDRVLLIADAGNNRVRQVNLVTGVITTVAGNGQAGYSGDGGLATHAMLHAPMAVALASDGSVFIADTGNACIRKVDAHDGRIQTWVTFR